jgi:hypothetical protein
LVLAPEFGISRVDCQDNRYKWINYFPPIILGCYGDSEIMTMAEPHIVF